MGLHEYHAHIIDRDNEFKTEHVKRMRPFVGLSAADIAGPYVRELLLAEDEHEYRSLATHRLSIRNKDRDHISITAFQSHDGDESPIRRITIDTSCPEDCAEGLAMDEYRLISKEPHK